MSHIADRVRVVVTGSAWLRGRRRAINSALREMLDGATHTIDLAVYRMTDGADEILSCIEKALARGVTVRLVVDCLEQQPSSVRSRLQIAHDRFLPRLHVWSFRSEGSMLHSKVAVVDRSSALVGSANLSSNGLLESHEIGLWIDGAGAEDVAACIDDLIASHECFERGRAGDPIG